MKCSKDEKGDPVGVSNNNPMLNTRVYEVKFADSQTQYYAANKIAANMYSQVDEEGYRFQLMSEIVVYKTDDTAISKDDGIETSRNGYKTMEKTTIGWWFMVLWKDGTKSWVKLKDLKASNPVEVADYASKIKCVSEPAFTWWVPYVLKKRDRIISEVNSRVKKATHKHGIYVPKNIKEAYAEDRNNGNTIWQDSIKKEMVNNDVAFEEIDDEYNLPVGYTEVWGKLIFDVKMDFTRKSRFVASGHMTPDPVLSTYAGVVSRESVRIAFTYVALNDLDIMAGDIQNAYLSAPCSKKYWIRMGPEFGTKKWENGR